MKYINILSLATLITVSSARPGRLLQYSENTTSTASDITSPGPNFNFSQQTTNDSFIRCASHPTEAQRQLLDVFSESQQETTRVLNHVVNVYVHIVASRAKRSQYNNAMIQDQLTIMNDAFASTGFSFELVGFDITVQEVWAKAAAGSTDELTMKKALRQGNYQALNLYFLSDLGNGVLGFAYFPTTNVSDQTKTLDGAVLLADSLPGGSATNYDMGLTAVHEVGHWFGLYHVFEGVACSDAQGDRVGDTPRQLTATYGCPAFKDTCPGIKGVDSFNNYMDYSYDACQFKFSSGQGRRMRTLFNSLRGVV